MKKWWILALLILAIVGCSNSDESSKTKDPARLTEQNGSEVESDTGRNGNNTFMPIEPPELDDTDKILGAINNLQAWPAIKTAYKESFNEDADLDPFKMEVDLKYAPNLPFIEKRYSDNYFAAKYESYADTEDYLYIKNEYGDKEWTLVEESFMLQGDVTGAIATMLKSIVENAASVDRIDEGGGEIVTHIFMTEGDFISVSENYAALQNILFKIGTSSDVLKVFEENTDVGIHMFSNITLDIYTDESNDITSYQLFLDFENGDAVIEQTLAKAHEEQDNLYIPADIRGE